jgi:hypothetical protein
MATSATLSSSNKQSQHNTTPIIETSIEINDVLVAPMYLKPNGSSTLRQQQIKGNHAIHCPSFSRTRLLDLLLWT